MKMLKKNSCLYDRFSVPTGTEVYGIRKYPIFEIIKGSLIEVVQDIGHVGEFLARIYVPTINDIISLNTRNVYTKLEDANTYICKQIIFYNELYLNKLKNAQNDYNKFINSIPNEYRYLINENNT